jgi:Ca2+/Na+ antiporter
VDLNSLLAGIALAIVGAHFLVDGGSAIARRLNVDVTALLLAYAGIARKAVFGRIMGGLLLAIYGAYSVNALAQ